MIVHPHGSVIFCDDIREEASRKLIFIGVYQDSLFFSGSPPWLLGRICCYIQYCEPLFPRERPRMEIILSRRDEGVDTDEVLGTLRLDIADQPVPLDDSTDLIGDGVPLFRATVMIPLTNLTFDRPSRIRVIMKRGDEDILLGALLIQQPAPSAEEQPQGAPPTS